MSEQPWVAPESPDIVWFSGADAIRFLNDIISQEIGDMVPGESRRSFLLEPQGKLSFLLWVLREDDRIALVTDPGRGEDLAAALGRYRIRVDVEIEVEDDPVWVVVGPWDGYDVSWRTVPRHLVIGDRPQLEEGSVDDYEHLRIAAGEPRWGVDVDGATIPHESGLVPASVDFDKGCFLGQELVARIDSRGANTPRRLWLLESAEGLRAGETVTADDDEIGVVTSAGDGIGLAMLKRGVTVGDLVVVSGSPAVVRDLPG